MADQPHTEYEFQSPFLKEAQARGMIFDITDPEGLDRKMLSGPVAAYIGFDPTADSLHVGNALSLMMLRLLARHGHTPIALMGGGTARIGDPSFRDEARALMSADQLRHNLKGIEKSIRAFLSLEETDAAAAPIFVNNNNWLGKLRWLDLLEDVGVQFSISRMLSFESVKQRLSRQQGLTFLEFNYSILQAYDFRELNRRHNAVLQMGGSDQWGNIVSGVELGRRSDRSQLFGLTTPLLTTASGAKMGKSASGTAVWVNADRLSVFEYWQFWRNTEDRDVGRFLKLFTNLPIKECEKLGALEGAELNEAKEILATEATAIAHGRGAALEAQESARKIFSASGAAGDLPEVLLSPEDLGGAFDEIREVEAYKLFVLAKLAASGGEARRLIRNGGAYIRNEKVTDENQRIPLELLHKGLHLSAGRKRHIVLKVIGP